MFGLQILPKFGYFFNSSSFWVHFIIDAGRFVPSFSQLHIMQIKWWEILKYIFVKLTDKTNIA